MKKSNKTRELRTFLKKQKNNSLTIDIDSFVETISPKNGHALDQLLKFSSNVIKDKPEYCADAIELVDNFRLHHALKRSPSCEEIISKSRPDLQSELKIYFQGCESNDIESFLKFQKAACIAMEKRLYVERQELVSLRFSNPAKAEVKNTTLNDEALNLLEKKNSYSVASKAYSRWKRKAEKNASLQEP